MKILITTSIILLLGSSGSYAQLPFLWDDDCTSDVDCAVTAAAVNKLADQHVINLVAVVADTSNAYAAPAMYVFEKYYRRSSVPIGAMTGTLNCSNGCNMSSWNAALVSQFDAGDTGSNYPSCVSVYRQAVAANPGIVIVMTGSAPCMAGFLASGADAVSPLGGAQLARQNVGRLIVLGGVNPSGTEFNIQSDPADWNTIFTMWTTQNGFPPLWMVDFNDGLVANAGPPAYANSLVNPELYAFQQAGVSQRPVWDSLAVLLGAYGLSMGKTTLFTDAGNGTQTINPATGANNWGTGTASGQHYVTNAASGAEFSTILDGYQNRFGYPALPPLSGTGPMLNGSTSLNGGVSSK